MRQLIALLAFFLCVGIASAQTPDTLLVLNVNPGSVSSWYSLKLNTSDSTTAYILSEAAAVDSARVYVDSTGVVLTWKAWRDFSTEVGVTIIKEDEE